MFLKEHYNLRIDLYFYFDTLLTLYITIFQIKCTRRWKGYVESTVITLLLVVESTVDIVFEGILNFPSIVPEVNESLSYPEERLIT